MSSLYDWEQRKLSGVIEKLSGGASIKPTDYLEDGIRTVPKGAVNATGIADLSGSKFISKDFFEKNITSHVHTNNLVTSLRDLVPSAPNMGRIVRIEGVDEQFLMPQGVYKLELFEGMDEDFLISFSNSDKYRKIISAEKNGSTQVHIRNRELLNIDINLPTEHEQQKIGTFFKQLDNTIDLHQRKLDLLNQLKQAYLQKMFPKNGEKVPEIRFADFDEKWEQRKLAGLADFSKGNGYTKNDLTEIGNPIILYGRLYTKYQTIINNVDSFAIEKDNSVISKGNEVIVPASGETSKDISRASVIGKPGIIIGGDLNIIRPKKFIDSVFLALTISNGTQQKEMTKRAQGKSVVHLHNSDLKQVNLLYPELEEQKQIGFFFKQFDNIVDIQQNLITQLNILKSAFLKKMFI
ncbi:restriction endonuclease subunit S [Enterococcus raffinosus]|uniref:Restriction endonuclease subunit S n=1 Tax=Enterococcus raffinosus TaxID=71452 RepID=A0AAW8TAP0_9ENTE|nr:restriction endonuclease subunit S [Enterococcus raffinosus]MDT2530325.1 restriction endonuclease subunit S [Enterococcus raffinosus]MDT2545436.1 restriction endonuclease subunit S [Enterococcus raffinosus]QXJ61777.1 restriction endonuclease subunit S [Enterococcus raffinosus]